MELTFDYYKNVQDPDVILCNPDRKELGYLNAVNRHFTLRFNNLSDFTFEMPKYISHRDGTKEVHPYYDLLTTKRLVFVEKIGWFRIKEVVETENSAGVNKSVTAESHQSMFKDFGFVEENRVYKFYDELDETDSNYNANNEEHMPSVVGQLYQQLGIHCNLMNVDTEPTTDYGEWTIIWIEESLKFSSTKTENICRTLGGNTESYGYDFMVSTVEEAFQVIFEFDFLHHAIKVKTTDSVTKPTNIYLSFDNLIQELSVTENSDEVVTVLSCVGSDLDITSVNPMGTNYICDFSYFKGNEENGYPWMSKELTDALDEWETDLENNKTNWKTLVAKLQEKYLAKAPLDERKQYINLKMQDTERARDDFVVGKVTGEVTFLCENVTTDGINNTTLYVDSIWYSDYTFDPSLDIEEETGDLIYLHEDAPKWTDTGFSFGNDAGVGASTINDAFFGSECKNLYFMEGDMNDSFCKLTIREIPDQTTNTSTREVVGFERYTTQNKAGDWVNLYSSENTRLENLINGIVGNDTDETEDTIKGIKNLLKEISDECNILSYFENNYPGLLSELKCYWVDGQYSNDTLKALDGTTVAENITLAQQLMEAGEVELNRVSQPRFNFSVTAANFLKIYEFVQFAREIQLGRVITVEKNETTHYYPSLTEMSFNLDTSEDFSLSFSNSLKLTDWGYTYADLIKNSSSTSRTVSSNWSNLMDYSKHKEEINDLLMHTLDRTLRAGLDNACAQEFLVDNTGILGRKINEDGTYQDKQIRLINNLILFTRDNWQTACTALGEITYINSSGKEVTSYGLATETLIGKLILGEELYIGNNDENVKITSDGITVTAEDGTSLVANVSGISIGKDGAYSSLGNCIFEDGEGNLTSVLNITSNLLTINTENFTLAMDGSVSCSNVEIRNGVIKSKGYEIGTDISNKTRVTGTSSLYYSFLRPKKYPSAKDKKYAFNIQGTFIAENATEVTDFSINSIWYQLNGVHYEADSYSLTTGKSGNRVTYTITVYTQEHDSLYVPSDFMVSFSYEGWHYDYKLEKGAIISFGLEPYIRMKGLIEATDIRADNIDVDNGITLGDISGTCSSLYKGSLTQQEGSSEYAYQSSLTSNELKMTHMSIGSTMGIETAVGNIKVEENAFRIAVTKGVGYLSGSWIINDTLTTSSYKSGNATFHTTISGAGTTYHYYDSGNNSDRTVQITGYQARFHCPEYTTNDNKKWGNTELQIKAVADNTYISSMSSGMYLQVPAGKIGHLGGWNAANGGTGTWVTDNPVAAASDINKKNSIEELDERYTALFDALTPVRYKYNNGVSGRYHTGFIAQSVKMACDRAGLDTNEFAAYIKTEEMNENGAAETTCYLRYEEFIALCINEIQKLKKEIKEIKGNET